MDTPAALTSADCITFAPPPTPSDLHSLNFLFFWYSPFAFHLRYEDALNTYNVIVKNKMFSNTGRLRVNIGNIYYEQRKYQQAAKHYKMALDQIPQTHKDIRYKIHKNLGTYLWLVKQMFKKG